MKIKIIALGKIKEKFLKDGIEEFLKRYYTYPEIIKKMTADSKPNANDTHVLNSREMVLFLSMLFQNFQYIKD